MTTVVKHNHPGTHLLTGAKSGSIQLWNAKNQNHVTTFKTEHSRDIHAISISQDGQIFASGGEDRHVIVWDTAKGSLVSRFSDHLSHVTDVSIPTWSRDILFSASHDGTAKCWDLRSRSRTPIQQFKSRDSINCVASPASGYVITCSSDGLLSMYDVRAGEQSNTIVAESSLKSISVSLSSPYIVAMGTSEGVFLCDMNTGVEVEHTKGIEAGSSLSFYDNDAKMVGSSGSKIFWREVGGEGGGEVDMKKRVTSLSVDVRGETKQVVVAVGGEIKWLDKSSEAKALFS